MNRPEQALQRAAIEYLLLALGKRFLVVHVPNGGQRSQKEAAILKGLGVRAGAADILISGSGFSGWIELKVGKGRRENVRGIEGVLEALRARGFRHDLLGLTPVLARKEGCLWRTVTRGEEIAAWLRSYSATAPPFVILDDDDDMGELAPYLVQTTFEVGLTQELAERAVEILRPQMGQTGCTWTPGRGAA